MDVGKLWRIKQKNKNRIQNLFAATHRLYCTMRYKICNQKEAINTNNNIFLIYTMGKVASMSVLDTITHRLPHVSTFAMHYMNPVNLQREEDKLSSSTHIDNQFYSKIHTLHAQKIEKYIERNPQKQKKIITIVREPISQIISLIFQQLNLYNLDKLEELDIENKQINYDYPTYWCNSELEHFCGINVLSEPFDCQKGYAIYNNGKFSVLVIRYENITQIFEEAMTEFTGIQGWNLSRRNVSSNKSYAKEYKEFKNRVKIAPEVLQKINSSLYVKHFYPE